MTTKPAFPDAQGAEERKSARYHEAGHAIIAIELGLGLSSVTVCGHYVEKDGGLGVGYGDKRPCFKLSDRELIDQAIRSCAGPVSERRYRHFVGMPQRNLFSSGGDHDCVEKVRKQLFMRGRNGYMAERIGWRKAQQLVELHWEAIECLAYELDDNLSPVTPRKP